MPRQLSRRTALSGLGAALLTGCTSSVLGGPVSLATGSETPSPPALPSVTVTTVNGPVVVPGAPLRVVALDTAELDSAMTLGITPVGAARAAADQGLPDYWPASRLAEIAYVGTIGNPDPTLVAAVRPQLILSNRTRDAAHYDTLRRIAPTVFTETTGYPWKADFQLHAQALSRQDQAAAVVAAYGRHVVQTIAAIGSAGSSGKRISIVRFVEGSPTIRLYGRQSFIGTLLADLQLGRPAAQNIDAFDVEVPPDQIAKADGDYLFYSTYGDPAKTATAATLAGAAWKALGAVQGHRAFPVDDQLWFEGIGYTGANLILAELQRALGG
ncbi:ABC transporter substrate-binding protein [Kitasatospora sp. MAP5-34]|uniref:ABC transporter substrate-binding protein n=1 Tax=Kitasatospora sp. MAP5-34 TaxID=3035102 RepID=UPI002474FF95|nr:ABC transporter substrate-binding protein [Kitasatospora sp. MAP5-34]MDH6577582.1 iron complex transport system substrate-binding protein [Kitasatospora sp. MAP5-34]